jgi:hypothetical protein
MEARHPATSRRRLLPKKTKRPLASTLFRSSQAPMEANQISKYSTPRDYRRTSRKKEKPLFPKEGHRTWRDSTLSTSTLKKKYLLSTKKRRISRRNN